MFKVIIQNWRNLFMLRRSNVESVAMQELREAQLALLEAQTGREYAEAMVRYHEARVRRLTTFVRNQEEV